MLEEQLAPEVVQANYYKQTANRYDESHSSEWNQIHAALKFVDGLSSAWGLNTLLDVGAGTGRALRFFLDRGKHVRGIEPVEELIKRGEDDGIPQGFIQKGSGYSLPFADNSVDAVLECAVLHHVPDPARVVAEMMRVAKRAVFLIDSNRFGQGHPAARMLKLILYKAHLWKAARFLQTKGKMYTITEGDGLGYSYSVFDSYDQLARWADTIVLMGVDNDRRPESWFHPLLTSKGVLLCAIKGALDPA
jgi:ubiquinone/menaquinone biosynthesis C-methylase UbiE